MRYVDYCYKILVEKCGDLDSIYEDHIEYLVGAIGLCDLVKYGYLESCGVVNGRRLYVLVNKIE